MAMTLTKSFASKLLKEEQFTFQRKIRTFMKLHDISKELLLNYGETSFSYITVANTCYVSSSEREGKEKQIMDNSTVTGTSRFLQMKAENCTLSPTKH